MSQVAIAIVVVVLVLAVVLYIERDKLSFLHKAKPGVPVPPAVPVTIPPAAPLTPEQITAMKLAKNTTTDKP